MARPAINDFLQVFPFWLFDTAPISANALPVFTPLSGFSSITSPEIQVETQDISEGNWHFKRKVVKQAEVSTITLQRGVTFSNSDFWRWIVAALTGNTNWQINLPFRPLTARIGGPSPRRQLILIHFFARNPLGMVGSATQQIINNAVGGLNFLGGLANTGLGFATGGFAGQSGLQLPLSFDVAARIPARAHVLHGCLPIRYKTGSDFDASSGAISIAELDVAPELVEEISLSS